MSSFIDYDYIDDAIFRAEAGVRKVTMSEGLKYDEGKPDYTLVPEEVECSLFNCHVKVALPLAFTNLVDVHAGHTAYCAAFERLAARWGNPADFYEQCVRGMTHGANKYGRENWKGVARERYYSAFRRHLKAGWYAGGDAIDSESGLHHLALAGSNLLIMFALHLEGK